MTIEKVAGSHRAPHPNPTSCRGAPNKIERLKLSASRPAKPIVHDCVGLADGASLQTPSDAIDAQCIKLVNVQGIVRSMGAIFANTTEDSAPEITAAFDLLEQEIQRIVVGLEEVSSRDRA